MVWVGDVHHACIIYCLHASVVCVDADCSTRSAEICLGRLDLGEFRRHCPGLGGLFFRIGTSNWSVSKQSCLSV